MGRKSGDSRGGAVEVFWAVDGAAAVEFAITAPMLVVLVLGIADYGLLMADSAALEGATRAGAEVAKANPERHWRPTHRLSTFFRPGSRPPSRPFAAASITHGQWALVLPRPRVQTHARLPTRATVNRPVHAT